MVVDDEIDMLTIVRRILEKWEFEVDTFSNPLNAHKVFNHTHKRYALVLIDLRMPEINGIALVVMLRRIWKDIQFMLMIVYDISIKDIQADVPGLKPLSLLRKHF